MITIYGDSLLKFVLYEQGKYSPNREFEHAYTERFGTELQNRSSFGSTAEKALRRMRRDAEIGKPFGDYCVIEFGGNDAGYDWPKIDAKPDEAHHSYGEPELFRENIRAMVLLARAQGAQPILTALPPIHADRYVSWICRAFPSTEPILRWSGGCERFYRRNEYYSMMNQCLARELGTRLVDLRSPFLLKRDLGELLCEDGIHPNREGQKLIYEAFCADTEEERKK